MVYFLNGEPIILTNTDTIQFIGGEIAPILADYSPTPIVTSTQTATPFLD